MIDAQKKIDTITVREAQKLLNVTESYIRQLIYRANLRVICKRRVKSNFVSFTNFTTHRYMSVNCYDKHALLSLFER